MAITPVAIGEIVARNAVPVAGVLFLGWSAGNTLLLYFWDTLLAIGVIFAGLGSVFIRNEKGTAATINGQAGAIGVAAFLMAFFAIPMGVPLIFVLGPSGFDWRAALDDSSLRVGFVMQAITAVWSYAELYRALQARTPEDLRLKRRFALVFARWIALLVVIYTGIGLITGPLLFVVVYAGISIYVDIAPDRFLLAFGDRDDADPQAAPASSKPSPPTFTAAQQSRIARALQRRRKQ